MFLLRVRENARTTSPFLRVLDDTYPTCMLILPVAFSMHKESKEKRKVFPMKPGSHLKSSDWKGVRSSTTMAEM